MKKTNILFLTHYFPPESNAPANRTFEHCRNWVKEANVTVITNFPNHPDGKIFTGYKNKLIQREIVEGINVVRLWTFITPNEGFLLRTLNYLVYMFAAFIYGVFTKAKFDVVIATTPQFFCGLAGKYISIIRRKKFILELRDLWPESIIAVGALKNKMIIRILEKVELNLYHSANKIISVTNSFKNNLISRGIEPSKIDVLFNGVAIDLFKNGKQISDQNLREFISSGFIVGYIGTIGMAHSLITLVDAAEKVKNSDIKFVIVGSGAERGKLEKEIADRNLKNIIITQLQPKAEIPSIIHNLDLFCVHLKKNDLFKTVIPSKIFEGMIMKKPILMGVEGEARDIIEDANCGLFFEPENSDDLVEKVLTLRDTIKLKDELGENGYNYVVDNFDRKKIASEYFEILEGVVE